MDQIKIMLAGVLTCVDTMVSYLMNYLQIYTVHCTLYTVQCTVYSVQCNVRVYCVQHGVYRGR